MKIFQMAMVSLFVLPALAFADDPVSSQGAPNASVPIPHGDTDLRMLLREVGARIHKHFVVDPRVRQTVDLGSLQPKDVTYPELLSVLEVNGWVVVVDEGLLHRNYKEP